MTPVIRDFSLFLVPGAVASQEGQLKILAEKVRNIRIRIPHPSEPRDNPDVWMDPSRPETFKWVNAPLDNTDAETSIACRDYITHLNEVLGKAGFERFGRNPSLYTHASAPSWLIHSHNPGGWQATDISAFDQNNRPIHRSLSNESNNILRPAMGRHLRSVKEANHLTLISVPRQYLIPLPEMNALRPCHRYLVASERMPGKTLSQALPEITAHPLADEMFEQICILVEKAGYIDANFTNFLVTENLTVNVIDTEPFGLMKYEKDPDFDPEYPELFDRREISRLFSIEEGAALGIEQLLENILKARKKASPEVLAMLDRWDSMLQMKRDHLLEKIREKNAEPAAEKSQEMKSLTDMQPDETQKSRPIFSGWWAVVFFWLIIPVVAWLCSYYSIPAELRCSSSEPMPRRAKGG